MTFVLGGHIDFLLPINFFIFVTIEILDRRIHHYFKVCPYGPFLSLRIECCFIIKIYSFFYIFDALSCTFNMRRFIQPLCMSVV